VTLLILQKFIYKSYYFDKTREQQQKWPPKHRVAHRDKR